MKKTISRVLVFPLAIGAIALFVILFTPRTPVAKTSDYAIASRLPFNQPDYYPIEQNLDPELYRPIAPWAGRLILPDADEYASNPAPADDWAWLEIYRAPPEQKDFIGKKVRLGWRRSPDLERYLRLVTTDIKLTPAAWENDRAGNVIPTRLDGRKRVGPLQALAGARPEDDVIVSFPGARVTGAGTVEIDAMPLMVTGRFTGLVKIIGEAPARSGSDIPSVCPGSPPCPSELIRVRHYSRDTKGFDGPEEVIRIPQQPMVDGGRFISTPRGLAESPEGAAGWYIYGAKGRDGLFTVQAIRPRSLFQLQATEKIVGVDAGTEYIERGNWKNPPERRGTASRVVVTGDGGASAWREGDRGLGIHLFGGIGGKKAESLQAWTVTGHYSFFRYRVARDPFTDELQWAIDYAQVYAQNPQGILSGSQGWANYTGNLQRGWLNSRPISNVIVKSDVLDDYRFGNVSLSPLTEFQRQLEIMMARYRTGDGTGVSAVTPATSCVQDSNQALYITIEVLKERVRSNPTIAGWVNDHPDDPETKRFQRLGRLGDRLEQVLFPRGVIRPDWKENAAILAGVADREGRTFTSQNTLANALLSWQSMLPRVSHDVMSRLFLEQGAELWFLRTNQVGGFMPEILPLAPTNLFGKLPIVAPFLRRLLGSIVLLPTAREWGITALALLVYTALALPIGFRSGFLRRRAIERKPMAIVKYVLFLFLSPSLWEEIVFRVLPLPYPDSIDYPSTFFIPAALALVVFMVYHPINALFFYRSANPTFFRPTFLLLTALLGVTCTLVYWWTGSLWTISIVHWLVVTVWLLALDGSAKFNPSGDRAR